jgi:hypothetical protein
VQREQQTLEVVVVGQQVAQAIKLTVVTVDQVL